MTLPFQVQFPWYEKCIFVSTNFLTKITIEHKCGPPWTEHREGRESYQGPRAILETSETDPWTHDNATSLGGQSVNNNPTYVPTHDPGMDNPTHLPSSQVYLLGLSTVDLFTGRRRRTIGLVTLTGRVSDRP